MIAPLILVALIWGITNPLIKRGSQGLTKIKGSATFKESSKLGRILLELRYLLRTRAYLVPLLINLSGSVIFIRALSDSS